MCGEMAEWLKARASKACIPLRVSGVRIPLSPPVFQLTKRLLSAARRSLISNEVRVYCSHIEIHPTERAAYSLQSIGSSSLQISSATAGILRRAAVRSRFRALSIRGVAYSKVLVPLKGYLVSAN